MPSDFKEFNLYLYCRLCSGVLGLIIWCLGPLADDSRLYGIARTGLAYVTCRAVRWWCEIDS